MSKQNGTLPRTDTPFDRFRELARKLVAVPKAEADAKEAAYQRKKAKKRGKAG